MELKIKEATLEVDWSEAWKVLLDGTQYTVENLYEEAKNLGKPPIEVIVQVWKIHDYDTVAKRWQKYFSEKYGWDLRYSDREEVLERHEWYLVIPSPEGKAIAIAFPFYYPDAKRLFPDKPVYLVPYYLFKIKDVKEEGLRGKFLDIVKASYKINASDIHFEIRDYGIEIKLRLLGDLRHFMTVSLNEGKQLIKLIKDIAAQFTTNFDPEAWYIRQDARIVLKDLNLDLRLAFTPSLIEGLQNFVIRLLSKSPLRVKGIEDLIKLGYYEEDAVIIFRQTEKSFGVIIIAGPTGSGKSRTLNTLLGTVPKTKKTLTVEDPVEYIIPNAVQHQVFEREVEGKLIKMDYLEYLRAFMRQDPDIILVGEWRKMPELTEALLYASETGHLVFTTLHANRVPTIPNLLIHQYGLKPEDISNNVNFLQNQRLVKKVCPYCSKTRVVTKEEIDQAVKKLRYKDAEKLYVLVGKEVAEPGEGCEHCIIRDPFNEENILSKGYLGRTVLYEFWELDAESRELLLKTTSALKIEQKMVEKSAFKWVDKSYKPEEGETIFAENDFGKLVKREEYKAKTFIDTLIQKVLKKEITLEEGLSKIL